VSPSLAKTPTPFFTSYAALLRRPSPRNSGFSAFVFAHLSHCILLVLRLGQWSCSLRNGVAAKQSVSLDLSCMKALLSSSIYLSIYLSLTLRMTEPRNKRKEKKPKKFELNPPSSYHPQTSISLTSSSYSFTNRSQLVIQPNDPSSSYLAADCRFQS